MRKIGLNIVALSHSVSQSHNYAVVLGEDEGNRRLPIVIGSFEAQAIAVAMENMSPSRPLTHDLFKNAMETFEIELKEVIINNLLDGIFYARLICNKGDEVIEIDSRTSDALALAVRFDCPIYTYEFVLDAAGIVLEEGEEEDGEYYDSEESEEELSVPVKGASLSSYSVDDLKKMLDEVLSEENYERAAEIRDELNKRQQGS
ncbi:MAG: bifunctional nuclease family protein [Saprospiraceae bacterium]|nr:bifunctional nuclease family protein [Saprospiraceae bacterium]